MGTRLANNDVSLWLVGGGSFIAGLIIASFARRRYRAPAAAVLLAVVLGLPSAAHASSVTGAAATAIAADTSGSKPGIVVERIPLPAGGDGRP